MKTETEETAWRAFDAWCRRLRLRALPAHPWTVAAFLNWYGAQPRAPDPEKVLRTLARVHLAKGVPAPDRHPIVAQTLNRLKKDPRATRGRRSLFPPHGIAAPETRKPTLPRKAQRRLLRGTPPLRSPRRES